MTRKLNRLGRIMVIALVVGQITGACRAGTVAGGLEWEQTRIAAEFPMGAQEIDSLFVFRNLSKQAVTITQIVPSCSCTTGVLEKKRYEPGESGKLIAQFKPLGRTGRLENWLNVTTDADKEPVHLELMIQVTERITARPRLVLWSGTMDRRAAQEILVGFKEVGEVKSIEVVAGAVGFETKVESTNQPGVWKLSVTPAAGVTPPVKATLELKALTAKAGELHYKVFAQVR